MEKSEVQSFKLVKGGIEFETAVDGSIWMGCETEFYQINNDSYNTKVLFNKKQWKSVRDALKYFPEQPIVMELDEEKIEISQCVLHFYS
jgi:hypothetical protein